MSSSIEHNYTGSEFLNSIDELAGMVQTLEESIDDYINALTAELTGYNDRESALEDSIYSVTYVLEDFHNAIDNFDQMVSNENLKAWIKKDGETGVYDIELNLSKNAECFNGAIQSFNDLTLAMHYLDKSEGIQEVADELEDVGVEPGAPTQMVEQRDRILEIEDKINLQYNRLTYSEIIARRNFETESSLETYDPEPPVFQMLNELENDKITEINEIVTQELQEI